MDKQILRHLGYELKYAEKQHPNQKLSLNEWLFVIRDKIDKCIQETNYKEKTFNTSGCSGCGYSGEEERWSVLFASMAIAYRGIEDNKHGFMSRLKCFEIKKIELDDVDKIELKINELNELKEKIEREKYYNGCED